VSLRKFIATIALAALGLALGVSPAFAFDHHFGVLVTLHGPHGNDFTATLFDPKPGHHKERVGHASATCRNVPHNEKCHFVIHLNGKFAGRGDIRARGELSHRDNKFNVIGGKADFKGVGGKMLVHPRHWHFDLTLDA
jgi:hypothetical protein